MPVLLLLAGAVILVGVVSVAMGRGGEMAEFPSDNQLPNLDDLVTAADVAALRPPSALWGYSTQVTDAALDRIAQVVTEREAEIAVLRQQLADLRAVAGPGQPAMARFRLAPAREGGPGPGAAPAPEAAAAAETAGAPGAGAAAAAPAASPAVDSGPAAAPGTAAGEAAAVPDDAGEVAAGEVVADGPPGAAEPQAGATRPDPGGAAQPGGPSAVAGPDSETAAVRGAARRDE